MLLTDEEAKAAAALVPLGQTIAQESGDLARYVGRILGTAPHDAVGLILGDPLRFVRQALAARYDKLLTAIFARRQIESTQPVSPSVAIPLLRAAYDESRPELQKVWAELIAAAMDPKRSDRMRGSFIKTVLAFDPLDSVVLQCIMQKSPSVQVGTIVSAIGREEDQVLISRDNLIGERCIEALPTDLRALNLTPYGRELMRACSD